jgi:hypothetical protein
MFARYEFGTLGSDRMLVRWGFAAEIWRCIEWPTTSESDAVILLNTLNDGYGWFDRFIDIGTVHVFVGLFCILEFTSEYGLWVWRPGCLPAQH